MQMKSTYPGLLIMPDGTEVRKGDAVEVSKGMSTNAGVSEWISNEWLVDEAGYKAPEDAPDVVALTTERDTLAAENADLMAKIAAMQADLDAATTPKDAPKK